MSENENFSVLIRPVTRGCKYGRNFGFKMWEGQLGARRGFTTRLKRIKPRAPDFGGRQHFGSKDNFQHIFKHYICIFVLVERTFFCCNHSAGVALKCAVHHERYVREEQHQIYVARTSNNRVIAAWNLCRY